MLTREELLETGCGTQIADDAIEHGYEPRWLGDNGIGGRPSLVLWDCNGVQAITTNGDATWQGSDPEGFAALLSQITAESMSQSETDTDAQG